MRHAEAEVFAPSDKLRPLTQQGMNQALQQGQWLHKTAENFCHVLVSPYLRAQQTFNQVNEAFQHKLNEQQETWDALTPNGNAKQVFDYLSVLKQEGAKNILIISHLPLVGEIVAQFCGQNYVAFYPACVAELDWQDEKTQFIASHTV